MAPSALLALRLKMVLKRLEDCRFAGAHRIFVASLGDLVAIVALVGEPGQRYINWSTMLASGQGSRVNWDTNQSVKKYQRRILKLGPEDYVVPASKANDVLHLGAKNGSQAWVKEGLAIEMLAQQMPEAFAEVRWAIALTVERQCVSVFIEERSLYS